MEVPTESRSYAELVNAYIDAGESLMTAETQEAGLATEAKMKELLVDIRDLENAPGFPSDSERISKITLDDWDAKHGVPADGP